MQQLSDTSFYAKVDKRLTFTNQQIVKSTIKDLIVKQELPATNLIITAPRTSSFYLLVEIYEVNNPCGPIVSACGCPATRDPSSLYVESFIEITS